MADGQRWVTTDYRVTADGGLTHKRWLNSDGTRKTGVELEKEKMRVELESISRRLIVLCPDDFDAFMAILDNPPEPNEKLKALMRNEPTCPFCRVFPFREEPLHGHYICSNCRNVTS